jgi:predicted exporter
MLLIAALGGRVLTASWLETGFLALLPASEQKPEVAKAIRQHNELRDRKLIWLVGAADSGAAINSARQLKSTLEQSSLFSAISLELPQQSMVARYQQLFPYRYQLLSSQTQSEIQADPKHFLEQNLETIYSPVGQTVGFDLERDPLILLSRTMKDQNLVKLSIEQGVPMLYGQGKHWVLMLSNLKNSHLQLDKLEELLSLEKKGRQQILSAGSELLVTGMPLFTAAGADSAKQEISTVGLGSSAGIFILMLLTFRSIRPLGLSFLAVGSGIIGALVISILVFGKIHIITLVFGASLIGVADDYALHFVCDSFDGKGWQPSRALWHLFPGLLIGLLTNLLSYAGLVLSPFPGLQEVALFSAVGLLLAWLTVVLLFPLLLSGFHSGGQPVILKFADYWQQHWPNWLLLNRRWLIPVLVIVMAGGLWQLTPQDDIRLLQSAPEELTMQADKIKQLLPISQDNQFFLVSGNSLEEWYKHEQRLISSLQLLLRQHKLTSYQGLSVFWPVEAKQQQNYQTLADNLYISGQVKQYMAGLGFANKAIDNELKQFQAAKSRSISLNDWLKSADEAKRNLWLGCDPSQCRSIVSLSGIGDLPVLAVLDSLPGVAWVDQVNDLSSLFTRYRIRASLLLAAAYLVVFTGLGCKFGWRNALIITTIPVVSALMSLAMLGWFNQLFSVFNLFALLLVLGIGVDDAVFFYMAGHARGSSSLLINKRTTTSLAVTLSALTTLLAFGLLAISSTEIVHAFGFTIAIGVLTALICSPLVGYKRSEG